jgi:hypothetical protein
MRTGCDADQAPLFFRHGTFIKMESGLKNARFQFAAGTLRDLTRQGRF